MKNKFTVILLILISILFCGWGVVGHRIINTKTVLSFPSQMYQFISWSSFLGQHASDADNRKNSDPNESPKHFIDIDKYSEFVADHRIPQDYDSVIAKYGSSFVIDTGILPWAIVTTVDSLTAQFKRRDWNKAQFTAADLGHYVGDSHMPLHITKNYNGQYTGQSGVHSRYESTMIGEYENSISYTPDTAVYISNVRDFVFSYLYENYAYVDSVLNADKAAKSYAGNTNTAAYYQKLWELTGNFTIQLFSEASNRTASLIYTAWVDAGSPDLYATSVDNKNNIPSDFTLLQNYPNPFNPSTSIKFYVPEATVVSIKIYDMLGREVTTLINNQSNAGYHIVYWNGKDVDGKEAASGIYLYRLTASPTTGSGRAFTETKKMTLLK